MVAHHDPYTILETIRRIGRCMAEHSHRLSRKSGLTLPQLLCLRAVAELGSKATIVAIGRRVQMGAPTVSGVVDRLERRGLVRRERGTSDRRRVFVRLTEMGQDKLDQLPVPLQSSFVARLQALSEAERTTIGSVLSEVAAMMEAEEAHQDEGIESTDRPPSSHRSA